LDALNGWQLVRSLSKATGYASAASFKHVSPAGAAVGLPLDEAERQMYFIGEKTELSDLAVAYVRARGADRMSSFGDFISLSCECDLSTAQIIKSEVSDGVIAPSYSKEALEVLKKKKGGAYTILQIDEDYEPPLQETRSVFGITFKQMRNTQILDLSVLTPIVTANRNLPPEAELDLLVASIRSSTPSPTRSVMPNAARPSGWGRDNSPGFTARAWPARKPTCGSSGRAGGFFRFHSCRT
jgi:phosphoribosylaminoimidazolecarboxamide formyltransferase/IMP cyclohydrolase